MLIWQGTQSGRLKSFVENSWLPGDSVAPHSEHGSFGTGSSVLRGCVGTGATSLTARRAGAGASSLHLRPVNLFGK